VFNKGLAKFMAGLDANAKVKFAAGDGAAEQSQLECFQGFLAAMPSLGHLFEENAGGDKDKGADGELEKFAAKHGLKPELVAAEFEKMKQRTAGIGA
jgi:hypothetical protein